MRKFLYAALIAFGLAWLAYAGNQTVGLIQYAGDGSIIFPTLGSSPHVEGKVFYDTNDNALVYHNDESEVELQIGQEEWFRARNVSGSTITNGSVVVVLGVAANLPSIELAQADTLPTACVVAMATHDIEHNSNGYVTITGVVRSVDTSAFSPGDLLYLSASVAGAVTATKPVSPNVVAIVGHVLISNPTQGSIHITMLVPSVSGAPATQVLVSGPDSETIGSDLTFVSKTLTALDDTRIAFGTPGDVFMQGETTTLSNPGATTVFSVVTGDGDMASLVISYTIQSTDTIEFQAEGGTVLITIVDDAGGVVASTPIESSGQALSSGTLTSTWTVVTIDDQSIEIQLNAASNLTTTTHQVRWHAIATGDVTLTVP